MKTYRYGLNGFTLLECLVALVVVAVGMAALWKGLLQGQYVSRELPERVIARWVAQNQLVSRQAMEQWPDIDTYTGIESMAGRDWYWREQVSATDIADIRRISLEVGSSRDSVLYSLEAYLHRTATPVPYERIFSR